VSICAVIPAAGNGTRLGSDDPKVFTKINDKKVVWDFLYENIKPHVDSFNLVLKPDMKQRYAHFLNDSIVVSEQSVPLGMGDAIFKGISHWSEYDYILVVWGDQVNISSETLQKVTMDLNDSIVVPFVKSENPYVEYVFNKDKLKDVLQTREGDNTSPGGLSDIGVFLLPTKNLQNYWRSFVTAGEKGSETGELNFLPFFTYLNNECNTPIKKIIIDNPDEAKGLNTKEDLAYFQSKISR